MFRLPVASRSLFPAAIAKGGAAAAHNAMSMNYSNASQPRYFTQLLDYRLEDYKPASSLFGARRLLAQF